MKRILALILTMVALAAIPLSAHAEEKKIDLSGLTYNELVELKDQINLAMWECDEWQEVEVPQGVWKVGEDIPAGKWTIKETDGNEGFVYVGSKLMEGGARVDWSEFSRIVSEKHKKFDASKHVSEWTIELKDGQYVQVDSATVVFTPYAGKPSLGFKK